MLEDGIKFLRMGLKRNFSFDPDISQRTNFYIIIIIIKLENSRFEIKIKRIKHFNYHFVKKKKNFLPF